MEDKRVTFFIAIMKIFKIKLNHELNLHKETVFVQAKKKKNSVIANANKVCEIILKRDSEHETMT